MKKRKRKNKRKRGKRKIIRKSESGCLVVAVPASISDAQLKDVAAYRSGGRIPILSYLHQNGKINSINSTFEDFGSSFFLVLLFLLLLASSCFFFVFCF